MSDDLRQMADGFRLGTAPSDDDVNRANWIIDRQSARIEELERNNNSLKDAQDTHIALIEELQREKLEAVAAAYEEAAAAMAHPADAQAALVARDKRVREEALRGAANYFETVEVDRRTADTILALVRQDDSMIEGDTDE